MDIVIVPFFDIKLSLRYGFRTRDSHIYEHLLKNADDRFLIINRPTSLLELFLRRKIYRTGENVVYESKDLVISKLAENIFVVDILMYEIFNVAIKRRGWIPYVYQHKKVELQVNKALEIVGFNRYSVYTSTPFAIPLICKLNATKRVLDADDNFTQHAEYAFYKDKIASFYELAKEKFNAIACTNSDTIKYFDRNCKAKLVLIPNGVDVERFRKQYECPEDLKDIPRPIVGYAGNMQRMLDVDLMVALSKSFPEVNFVFIGNILDKKLISPMFNHKNILYLGDKTYDEYPKYVKHFDICSIPYVVENQHGGDPMKFYEFMAAQKPIISTSIGEIAKYHDGKSVLIVDRKDYEKGVRNLVSGMNCECGNYPEVNRYETWQYKADLFKQELQI